MILGIDVGNTNITFGILSKNDIKATFRLTTNKNMTYDELGSKIINIITIKGYNVNEINDVIIASVVPCMINNLVVGIKNYFNIDAIVLKPDMNLGIDIKTDYPSEVGIDRIVDMVATKYMYGYPAVVIDFGTATTYDLLDDNSAYIAGVTAPGIKSSLSGLVEKASKLTNIEIRDTSSVLAKNTKDSMNVGIVYGQVGQVLYIIDSMKKESNLDPKVVITGGLGLIIKDKVPESIYDINLTLHGLRIIYNEMKNEYR